MKLFCPLCEQEQEVTNISSTVVNVRGEDIVVSVKMYKCSVCGEIFDDPANPQDELAKAYEIYRDRHGYIQPEEIKKLRKKYGLTQKELADLLGWSVATLNKYEKGALADSAHNNILKALRDPHFVINLVKEK